VSALDCKASTEVDIQRLWGRGEQRGGKVMGKGQEGAKCWRDSLSRHNLQVVRVVAPVTDDHVPAGQFVHMSLAAVPTYFPAEQRRQSPMTVAPVVARYFPMTHSCSRQKC